MRIKTIMTACLAVPALSVLCLLSSCSSEELPTTEKPSTGPQTLTLNLKPADTRAAIYSDPAKEDPNPENKIISVTIGIFGSDNNVKTIQDAADPSNPSITTSQLEKDDHVLVAVNAKPGTFTGAKTVTEFEDKTLAIDYALAGGEGTATTVAKNNLPMFGVGKISGSSPSFSADVTVYHMVAKITLKSLNVNFSATGAYSAATFTPTEVFMSNVPEKLEFNPADAYTYIYADGTYYNGEAGKSSVRDYLGTGTDLGTLKDKTLAATSNWGTAGTNLLYFYTMPNNSASPTQLVIKGTFDPDGKGTNKGDVYYPVNINYNSDNGSAADLSDGGKDGTAKHVYPNKNYVIAVIIKGKGADSPTKSLDPQTVTATVTVNPFVDATQSNTFN